MAHSSSCPLSVEEFCALPLGTIVGVSESGYQYRGEIISQGPERLEVKVTQSDRGPHDRDIIGKVVKVWLPRHSMCGIHFWDLQDYLARYL